ncbi:MOSC domain-containing protein [Actinoplanes friuliensis]|uniref:MOSC domain-containing protein n=1 Tax=Actinoplanes friuliensis TaxID=196914 RepID=UPI0005A1F951|nr:MOSC N-terminal beta barrel domain-containing protein [Actinoplanes friuliensis]
MEVVEIRRFPVKSLGGELLQTAQVEERGLAGDRLWAVRDEDGKLGSGKNTRRFRRMPGLLSMRAHGDGVVELPDGRRFAVDDPAGHRAVSHLLSRNVTIEREQQVKHHDEGPVSVISTAALRRLGELVGEPVDPLRFRANVLVDLPGSGFLEDGWLGGNVQVGPEVVLRPVRRLTRCVMVDLGQKDGRLLKAVADHHEMTFGVWATVERPGRIAVADSVRVG